MLLLVWFRGSVVLFNPSESALLLSTALMPSDLSVSDRSQRHEPPLRDWWIQWLVQTLTHRRENTHTCWGRMRRIVQYPSIQENTQSTHSLFQIFLYSGDSLLMHHKHVSGDGFNVAKYLQNNCNSLEKEFYMLFSNTNYKSIPSRSRLHHSLRIQCSTFSQKHASCYCIWAQRVKWPRSPAGFPWQWSTMPRVLPCAFSLLKSTQNSGFPQLQK